MSGHFLACLTHCRCMPWSALYLKAIAPLTLWVRGACRCYLGIEAGDSMSSDLYNVVVDGREPSG